MYHTFNRINFHLVSVLLWIVISYSSFCSLSRIDRDEYLSHITSHHTVKRQTSECKDQFRKCKSGECIDEAKFCDGVKNCKDGSDETVQECEGNTCPSYLFACAYGACIEGALKCNGKQNCVDNSDETHEDCGVARPNPLVVESEGKCKSNEWECKSGKCIPEDAKCDGKGDCDDGTDERIDECGTMLCPSFSFRCNYGACIQTSAKCNGVKDCFDGSDESASLCAYQPNTVRPAPAPAPIKPTSRPEAGTCDVPKGPIKTVYTNGDNDNWSSISPGSKVPRYSQISATCDPGYALPNGKKIQKSICYRANEWNPPLEPCSKTCPKLSSTNVDLSCYRDERKVNCDGELLYGTRVRPKCKPLFHEETIVDYRELVCEQNGQWSDELIKCVPDCGLPNTTPETLIFEGTKAKFGDSPWHTAIYKVSKNPTLICGGTLISTRMVVSAAHCFYNENGGMAANKTTDYEIVLGKYTRDYKNNDNKYTKKYEVSDLIYTDLGYNPSLTGQHGHDIIVIVLKKIVEISTFVLPACVDWRADTYVGFQPPEGTYGKLVGWGVDKIADEGNPILLSAELPFISYRNCVGKLKHITPDKFCAGNETGPGARKGDSGGGLMFPDQHNGHYYLRGIVSTKDKNSNSSIATFTDVAKHLDWLDKVRNMVERKVIRGDTTIPSKTG